jgi:DNA-binding NarL/FixJ family response regulator
VLWARFEGAALEATSPTRLLIAEDDYLVREGARAVLDAMPGLEVVVTVADATGLVELLAEHEIDVVVLDIRMPPSFTTEGIEVAHQVRREHPDVGIVVLSQHDDPEYALELLRDGSNGVAYLLKERLGDADRLVQAIEEVTLGGSMLDPRIVEALLQAQRRRTASRLAGLTPRELEVLTLMASGKGNLAISRDLSITERSVEKHTNAIFRKLGLSEEPDLNRRVAAVLFYLQRTMI